MIGATMAAMLRWDSAAQFARISGKATVMNDDWVVAYRSTPAGSPDAGRVACVFISSDGMAMTLSDGSKRHEVEAITDTAAGRLEAALRVRDWLGGPAMTGATIGERPMEHRAGLDADGVPHLSADEVLREVAVRRGVALADHRGWSCEWGCVHHHAVDCREKNSGERNGWPCSCACHDANDGLR